MRYTKAFTLIELLVVLFLFSLFAGLSLPSLFSWVKSTHIKTDASVCLEMKNIITKGIKSKRIDFDTEDYAIKWSEPNKKKLRSLLASEMGKIPTSDPSEVKVKKPRQGGYAFFVYLLPPYTTICLPINSPSNIDENTINFGSVTDEFLSQRYSQSHYPQMYIYDTTEEAVKFKRPTILKPGGTVNDQEKHSYIGCINIKEDFD